MIGSDATYWLYAVDAVVRIVAAVAFLFIAVPWLAKQERHDVPFLTRFFWNAGAGIALITLCGHVLSLGNLFSPVTLLLGIAVVILWGRARGRGVSPWTLARRLAEDVFLAILNIVERRVNVRRRIRRAYRRLVASIRAKLERPLARLEVAGWTLLILVAAAFRLYRPFASANLGFADTYGHLYLLKLLADGRQVDPEFGPYPRGLHFLLMAIRQLTNVDEILLMNVFGAIAGVLIALAVADTARRLSGSVMAGLLAGLLFATYLGGPTQFFVLGGLFETDDRVLASVLRTRPYQELSETAGEFDVALTDFHRQTSTLPQELAIALLFPAAMFLFDYFRRPDRWLLLGYGGCTAAIAAVHSGVLLPLALMSGLALLAVFVTGQWNRGTLRPAVLCGAAAAVIGSVWVLGFIAYPYAGGTSHFSGRTSVASAVLYYFPFLRPLANAEESPIPVSDLRVYATPTPFLIVSALVAAATLILALARRDDRSAGRFFIGSAVLLFMTIHFSAALGVRPILEVTRNSQWMVMALMSLAGVAAVDLSLLLGAAPRVRLAAANGTICLLLLVLWATRVPLPAEPAIRDRIINYSGYGGTAYAVLRIEREFEPYTWTLVTYGQEFPMVLRRGFHVPAVDFLEHYDPTSPSLAIPTPHVFVVVEKTAHRFQINTWAARFNRAEIEERLQTWIHVYQATHSTLRLFLEDEDVRVYHIEGGP
jgi:hypothetical protein